MPEESEELQSSPFAFYAFYQLHQHLKATPVSRLSFQDILRQLYPDYVMKPGKEKEKTSLFITWEKQGASGREDFQLRGCIGTFARPPLLKGIERYSLIAALQDDRFPPIRKGEFPRLKCSCNILHNFTTIYKRSKPDGDIFDWEIGVHGIELKFEDPGTGRILSATFLPEVMPEQGWDKQETFQALIEKAGYYRDIGQLIDSYDEYFVEVLRYEGDKSAIAYEEFSRQLEQVI
ncbi:AMMECR1 domain-containing protein [Lachancea thermotolerans]